MVSLNRCLHDLGLLFLIVNVSQAATHIVLPDTCHKTYNVPRGSHRPLNFSLSYDFQQWLEYSYKGIINCFYIITLNTFRDAIVYLVFDVQSEFQLSPKFCPFQILLYPNSIDDSQPIKRLDCTISGRFLIHWPTNQLVLSFRLLSKPEVIYDIGSPISKGVIRIGYEYPHTPAVYALGYRKNNFIGYQMPHHEVSSGSECEWNGCLENTLQGYHIHVSLHPDNEGTTSKLCSYTFHLYNNPRVCLRQVNGSLTSPNVSLYISGIKYLDLANTDVLQWWCLPWNASNNQIKLTWKVTDETDIRQLFVISMSSEKKFKKCPVPELSDSLANWDIWSGHGDHMQDPTSEADTRDDDDDSGVKMLFAVAVPVLVLMIVCLVAVRLIRKNADSDLDTRNDNANTALPPPAYRAVYQRGAEERITIHDGYSHDPTQHDPMLTQNSEHIPTNEHENNTPQRPATPPPPSYDEAVRNLNNPV